MKNDVAINTKKKSKFSILSLDIESANLNITPFGAPKEEEKIFTFSLAKLRTIHKKYIEQGKITLQFLQKSERLITKGMDVMATQEQRQIFTSILVSSASKQNLQLLISKITEIKKKEINNKKQQTKQSVPLKPVQPVKKKPNVSVQDEQQMLGKMNRKDLRNLSINTFRNQSLKPLQKYQTKQKVPLINFFDLPCSLLENIFQYCKLNLRLRLVNKKFSAYVLQNIHTLKLNEFIDEATFNKLAMWAVNVECKMINVKNLDLKDRFEEQQLIKNRAKTLKFGQWKQISARNITQIKGLRTYCLQLPYSMKFDLSNLYGQRMVELRLKGTLFAKNDFIKSESLGYILKNIRQIKVLELPCCSSDLFDHIQYPKRLQQLSLYSIIDFKQSYSWANFSKFQNLTIFNCCYLQKGGLRKEKHQVQMVFPQNLQKLQIGSFIAIPALETLPQTITHLRLIGDFYNKDLENMILPALKELNVVQAKYIRAQIIQFLQNVTLLTSWNRQTVQYMSRFANERNIILKTTQ